jgi:hypothetical protein
MAHAGAVLDGVGASATQIADGLITWIGEVNGGEVSSAMGACQLDGIAPIGFDLGSTGAGQLGGRDDDTLEAAFLQIAREDESGRTGLVSETQTRAGLLDLADKAGKSLQLVGDGAVEANLGVAVLFGNGNDNRIFVDIEPNELSLRLHALVS